MSSKIAALWNIAWNASKQTEQQSRLWNKIRTYLSKQTLWFLLAVCFKTSKSCSKL